MTTSPATTPNTPNLTKAALDALAYVDIAGWNPKGIHSKTALSILMLSSMTRVDGVLRNVLNDEGKAVDLSRRPLMRGHKLLTSLGFEKPCKARHRRYVIEYTHAGFVRAELDRDGHIRLCGSGVRSVYFGVAAFERSGFDCPFAYLRHNHDEEGHWRQSTMQLISWLEVACSVRRATDADARIGQIAQTIISVCSEDELYALRCMAEGFWSMYGNRQYEALSRATSKLEGMGICTTSNDDLYGCLYPERLGIEMSSEDVGAAIVAHFPTPKTAPIVMGSGYKYGVENPNRAVPCALCGFEADGDENAIKIKVVDGVVATHPTHDSEGETMTVCGCCAGRFPKRFVLSDDTPSLEEVLDELEADFGVDAPADPWGDAHTAWVQGFNDLLEQSSLIGEGAEPTAAEFIFDGLRDLASRVTFMLPEWVHRGNVEHLVDRWSGVPWPYDRRRIGRLISIGGAIWSDYFIVEVRATWLRRERHQFAINTRTGEPQVHVTLPQYPFKTVAVKMNEMDPTLAEVFCPPWLAVGPPKNIYNLQRLVEHHNSEPQDLLQIMPVFGPRVCDATSRHFGDKGIATYDTYRVMTTDGRVARRYVRSMEAFRGWVAACKHRIITDRHVGTNDGHHSTNGSSEALRAEIRSCMSQADLIEAAFEATPGMTITDDARQQHILSSGALNVARSLLTQPELSDEDWLKLVVLWVFGPVGVFDYIEGHVDARYGDVR